MEENKTVKMKADKPEKLSYEQLEEMAKQLSQQNMQMRKQVEQINIANMLTRLDFLIRVAELASKGGQNFSVEFIEKVYNEIMTMVMPPVTEEKEVSNGDKTN